MFDGLEDDNTKAYYNYLVDLAVIFGADQSQAQREIEEAVQFEMELAEVINIQKFIFFENKNSI